MERLLDKLRAYAECGALPMHMPGHKRNDALAPYLRTLGARLDVTEIDGFDDLHDAHGVLRAGMARAARVWGAQNARFLVGGGTSGILAGVRALTKPGDRVLVARNSHKSVFHALELCGLEPVYLMPPVDPVSGICGAIPPEDVATALAAHPDISLILITSPTYEGVVSDVAGIARVRGDRPLMIDSAHGAHQGLSPAFGDSAVASGADAVVLSLHKTLPSLTQTALLCFGGRARAEKIDEALGVFETSSPSYPLMASIDECVRLIEQDGVRLANEWAERLDAFERAIAPFQHLTVLNYGADKGAHPTFYAFDRSKLCVMTTATRLTGAALGGILREKYRIEPEMCACDYTLCMTGMGDTESALSRLARALLEIDRDLTGAPVRAPRKCPPVPPRALNATQARLAPSVVSDSPLGRVSAETVAAYPPGIPLIVPGEVFTSEILDAARDMAAQGVRLQSDTGLAPERCRVVAAPNKRIAPNI